MRLERITIAENAQIVSNGRVQPDGETFVLSHRPFIDHLPLKILSTWIARVRKLLSHFPGSEKAFPTSF
jgi:hypothetical protein